MNTRAWPATYCASEVVPDSGAPTMKKLGLVGIAGASNSVLTVYGDALEDSAGQAENMKLRAELMTQIRDYVEGLNMTQQAAARSLGLTQPRLSDLLRGRLDRFSLDMLVNVLARAGKYVNVTISDQDVA